MDKRHFTVVVGSKEHGLYISSSPSSAAKKAVSKLCASNKSKKVEFCLREITQGSKKKTYGPYLGEMKKLKKPIELKGRVIRYDIIVHLKKGKSSTIKTAKKMRGGNGENEPVIQSNEPVIQSNQLNKPLIQSNQFNESLIQSNQLNESLIQSNQLNEPVIQLNTEIKKFRNFISTHFPNNSSDVKIDILQRINSMLRRQPGSRKGKQYFFYVFRTNPKPNKLISVGSIPHHDIKAEYLFIGALLSRQRGNRGGTSAIYHILDKLPQHVKGICLSTTADAFDYYRQLGFVIVPNEDNMMKFDKTKKNMEYLKKVIEKHGKITTEFYSNCPYLEHP